MLCVFINFTDQILDWASLQMYSRSVILLGIEGSISRFAIDIPYSRHPHYNNNLTRSDKKLAIELLHRNKQK